MPFVSIEPRNRKKRYRFFEASLYAIPHLIQLMAVDHNWIIKRQGPLDAIMKKITEHTGVSAELMKSKTRLREVVFARHLFFYIASKDTSQSLKTIGIFMGDRDHTTVIHAARTIHNFLDINLPEYQEAISILAPHLGRSNFVMEKQPNG